MSIERLFLGLLLLPVSVLAQSSTIIAALTQSEVYWKPGVQVSDETQAVLTQLAAGPAGVNGIGTIGISQSGTGNQAGITGSGTGNQLTIIQNGNDNQLSLELYGNQNSFGFAQNGSSNVLDLRNVRANNERLDVLQQGNANRLSSDGYPFATGVPIRIEQAGGMQIQITNVR